VIDVPYNTGNDSFVYPDNFAERKEAYLKRINEMDDNGYLNKDDLFRKNARESGHFHSNWLGMMYPRLYLARNLLREDGVIFVHIDDHEVHNLRHLMDEVFGEESFLACFIWHRRQMADSRNQDRASTDHEYILSYRNQRAVLRGKDIDLEKFSNPDNDPRGSWFSADLTGLATKEQRPNLHYPIENPKTGLVYPPSKTRGWSISKDNFHKYIEQDMILWPSKPEGRPRLKKFLNDVKNFQTGFSSMLDVGFTTEGTREIQELFGEKIFPFAKPLSLLKTLIRQGTSGGEDIILDFFAGSCPTAQAVLELNQEDGRQYRFVMVQLPEPCDHKDFSTIADIGKERIRRVIARLKKEHEGALPLTERPDLGFKVFKLRPSNFRMWRSDVQTSGQLMTQLEMFQYPIKPQAERENQLWEILLKAGYPLSAKVEEKELGGHPIHIVEEGKLVIALNGVSSETIDAVIRIKPLAFICPDSLFGGSDPLKTNTALQLKDAGIDFKSL